MDAQMYGKKEGLKGAINRAMFGKKLKKKGKKMPPKVLDKDNDKE